MTGTAGHPLYGQASDMAKAKAEHYEAPGTDQLPKSGGYWPSTRYGSKSDAKGHCTGQLRTAYVRIAVGGERDRWGCAVKAGRPSWQPIGVVCDGCRVLWPAPSEGVK